MGIDGVGKSAKLGVPLTQGTQGTESAAKIAQSQGPSEAFSAHLQRAQGASQAGAVEATVSLQGAQAVAIDFAQYVEQQVSQATAHLQGLSANELAEIQQLLRDEMALDPALQELALQAGARREGEPE